jgi:putative oxidoreductase
MKKFLQLSFIPQSVDLGLLVLRVALGVQMIFGHGWGKLTSFSEKAGSFDDPLGVGSTTSLALAVTGEVLCSLLIALGLFTRLAAVGAIVTMSVAFFLVHHAKLTGEHSGELAFVYLVGFVTIFLAGPGRFSIDSKLGR